MPMISNFRQLISWNMQGAKGGDSRWTRDVRRMIDQSDFVILQECGAPPAGAKLIVPKTKFFGGLPPHLTGKVKAGLWNVGTRNRPLEVYMLWCNADTGGNRCNLAILSWQIPFGLLCRVNPIMVSKRPMLGLVFPTFVLANIHAFATGGADGPKFIQDLLTITATKEWFCAGDYNRNPIKWNVPLAGSPNYYASGQLWFPGMATHDGRKILDYGVCSQPRTPHDIVEAMTDMVGSDHRPVRFIPG